MTSGSAMRQARDKRLDVTSTKVGRRVSPRMILHRWLREPLLHFLLIGSLLFVIYAVWGNSAQPGSKRIELSPDDLQQLQIGFAAQWERQPTSEELAGLVENRVREEILYREALAMGLDKDDNIVKRRMAQKMQFLAEDLANAHEPTTNELKVWFNENAKRFEVPGRLSFRHVYFSPDQRGQRAHDDALAALAKVAGQPEDSSMVAALGDRFMFQDYYGDRAVEQIAKDFGSSFAQALFQVKSGSWQGPIESGYGWHLIFIDTVTPSHLPAFEEVEPEVRSAWLADQKSIAWDKAYATMRAKYFVVLPTPSTKQPATASASSVQTTNPRRALAGSQ